MDRRADHLTYVPLLELCSKARVNIHREDPHIMQQYIRFMSSGSRGQAGKHHMSSGKR